MREKDFMCVYVCARVCYTIGRYRFSARLENHVCGFACADESNFHATGLTNARPCSSYYVCELSVPIASQFSGRRTSLRVSLLLEGYLYLPRLNAFISNPVVYKTLFAICQLT